MGLVLDEPTEKDRVTEVEGMTFVLDGELWKGLEQYLPAEVDFDDRFWTGLRVRPARRSAAC